MHLTTLTHPRLCLVDLLSCCFGYYAATSCDELSGPPASAPSEKWSNESQPCLC
ncbi:hypothetical protein TSMEX_008921 [Taenia solium]|eukprot:TsM_000364200 transcript=TsM_000364200 gene=TsM_000364200